MKNPQHFTSREGTLTGGMYYLAEGAGPPLVMFNAVVPSAKKLTGLARWRQRQFFRPLSQRYTVYSIGRKPHLETGASMTTIAADYAQAIIDEFNGQAIDLLGISTGGSVALQFAADHSELVRRLVVVASSYRLGPLGRDVQKRYADLIEAGKYRQALAALVPAMTTSRLGRWAFGAVLSSLAPLLLRTEDPSGLVAMLRAEDAFDLWDRLSQITAPTLLIGGDSDSLYPPDLVKQTAEGIPQAQVHIYQGRNHGTTLTDRRLFPDILAFLTDEQMD